MLSDYTSNSVFILSLAYIVVTMLNKLLVLSRFVDMFVCILQCYLENSPNWERPVHRRSHVINSCDLTGNITRV